MLYSLSNDSLFLRRLKRAAFGLGLSVVAACSTSVVAQEFSSLLPVERPAFARAVDLPQDTIAAETVVDVALPAGGLTTSRLPSPRPLDFYKRAIRSGESITETSGVSGAISYAVGDLTGDILEVREPLRRLPPASVAKAITAIYALEHLGGAYRFTTDVLATGPVEGGIVQGDLILAGSGDPTLDTDHLHDLAASLKAAGVTGLTGSFYVYGGALPRLEQIDHQQTEYASYNPALTGLNVNYNRVHFEWRRQGADYALKLDARTAQRVPSVRIARMRIAERGLPVFDHTPLGDGNTARDDWSVSRRALGNAGARWLPVRLPSLYAGELFVTLSKGQGMTLPAAKRIEALPETAALMVRHQSASLTTIARDMLKYSTNLTAEVLGLTATQARGLPASDLATSAGAMSAWAKARLGTYHMDFVDHSGLGGASVITTSDMVRVLSAPGVETLLGPILKPIAVLDGERNVVNDSGIEIAAKTGTLDFVSTLAGYVSAPDGRRMAFAIFSGDLPKRAAAKANGEAVPTGARTFNTRSKKLQQALIQRWAQFYGGP